MPLLELDRAAPSFDNSAPSSGLKILIAPRPRSNNLHFDLILIECETVMQSWRGNNEPKKDRR